MQAEEQGTVQGAKPADPLPSLTISINEAGGLAVTAPVNQVVAFGLLALGALAMIQNATQPARVVVPDGPVPKGGGFMDGLRQHWSGPRRRK